MTLFEWTLKAKTPCCTTRILLRKHSHALLFTLGVASLWIGHVVGRIAWYQRRQGKRQSREEGGSIVCMCVAGVMLDAQPKDSKRQKSIVAGRFPLLCRTPVNKALNEHQGFRWIQNGWWSEGSYSLATLTSRAWKVLFVVVIIHVVVAWAWPAEKPGYFWTDGEWYFFD